MSPSFFPPVSSSLKRPLPSGGFQDSDDTLPRKQSRLQHEGFPHRMISLSSAVSPHGPKSLLQNKTERSMKTSPRSSDPSTSIRRTICLSLSLSRPTAAMTGLKCSTFAKDSERDFKGPKSLAEILKEKRQRSTNVNVNGAVQDSEPEEGEFIPSNDTDDASQDSSSHSTSGPSSASVSPSHASDSDVGSKLESTSTPAPSMPSAEEAESQLAVASKDMDDVELDGEIDDAEFDSDIDIDDAQLELFFEEQDYAHCKNYVMSYSHL